MSETISKRIQQLENQNVKLKKLLESTLKITHEDSAKCLQLRDEANSLKKMVSDLENQKKQLEDELKLYVCNDSTKPTQPVDIRATLNKTLNELQRESTSLHEMTVEDSHLKDLISDLEQEKDKLLLDIEMIKEANDNYNILIKENLKLKQELAVLEANSTHSKCTGQDFVNKLTSIENMQNTIINNIDAAKKFTDPLGTPMENTVLELKLKGLERQKETVLHNLKATLLQSANEISALHSNTSDGQLRGLLNELDINKTILIMNLNDVKEMQRVIEEGENKDDAKQEQEEVGENSQDQVEETEKCYVEDVDDPTDSIKQELIDFVNSKIIEKQSSDTPEPNQSFSLTTNSSEIVQQVTDISHSGSNIIEMISDQCEDRNYDTELPTVSEEDEAQNELIVEHEQLKTEIAQLESQRDRLLEQIQHVNTWPIADGMNLDAQNELHGTFMREESSEEVQKLPLDDATNQMYANEEQMLVQRIRDLEEDNERIKRDLNLMLEETQSHKEDSEVNDVMKCSVEEQKD